MFNFEELKKLDEKQKLAVHCLCKENLEKRLEEIEKQEQNPEIFSDFEKLKSIGTEKKALSIVLEKIHTTTKIKYT